MNSSAPQFTVDYFIAKFEAIPEEEWCEGEYVSSDGRKCALGHCGHSPFGLTFEREALINLFKKSGLYASDINDGKHSKYQQPTPKQRILAALRDIKERQSK